MNLGACPSILSRSGIVGMPSLTSVLLSLLVAAAAVLGREHGVDDDLVIIEAG